MRLGWYSLPGENQETEEVEDRHVFYVGFGRRIERQAAKFLQAELDYPLLLPLSIASNTSPSLHVIRRSKPNNLSP